MKNAVISSTGRYLPLKEIKNSDLDQITEEARILIEKKTGVLARRVAADNECTSDLAVKAAIACLNKIDFSPEQIQGIIVSTSSPDRMQPATATRVQHILGAKKAFAVDINSVCSGSTFGISIADSFIRSGKYENILFIASEVYSRILNKTDFSTYPFFGDGAGAILFHAKNSTIRGVLHSCLETDGSKSDTVCVPGGGTMLPFEKMKNPRSAFFRMKGPDVFSFTIDKAPKIIFRLIDEAGVPIESIKCFICHQANVNIIHRIAELIGISKDRFYINVHRYGNTASASVLIALDEAISEGFVVEGDIVATVAFGGGLSWGANLIRI
ncbi:MAG: 3-oxoacyl-ACP synthase III family protein [Syntrophales bacterium]